MSQYQQTSPFESGTVARSGPAKVSITAGSAFKFGFFGFLGAFLAWAIVSVIVVIVLTLLGAGVGTLLNAGGGN